MPTTKQIDQAFTAMCVLAPMWVGRFRAARAMLLQGAYIAEATLMRFPNGVTYDVQTDTCTCQEAGHILCLHQLAARIRRVALGIFPVVEAAK